MIYKNVMLSDNKLAGSKFGLCEPEHRIGVTSDEERVEEFCVRRTRSGTILGNTRLGRTKLAIACTCRQMYLEAADIWYSNIRFVFSQAKDLDAFVTCLGNKLDSIRCIKLVLWDVDSFRAGDFTESTCRRFIGLCNVIIDNCRWQSHESYWTVWGPIANKLIEGSERLKNVTVLGNVHGSPGLSRRHSPREWRRMCAEHKARGPRRRYVFTPSQDTGALVLSTQTYLNNTLTVLHQELPDLINTSNGSNYT